MSIDDFVHLHTHSDMSQLDGCGKISEYVKAAKLRGHKAIAFTDHGTTRGIMVQHESCKEVGIKPIFGSEFYVARDMHRKGVTDEERAALTKDLKKGETKGVVKAFEEREGIRDRWHITVWASNAIGLRNLYRLSSKSWIDGFYYKPRIDLKTLIEHGEGLMVASGCLSSPVNDSWLIGKKRQAFEFSDLLHEAFGDRYWLEVQPHAIRDQRKTNELMLKLRDRYGGENRLLATQDAHYVNREDAEHHEVLLCIGTGSNMSDPDRFKFDGDEFHFRTRKEMEGAFARHHEFIPSKLVKEALNSTMELAESCSAKIEVDYHAALLPDPGIPKKYKGNQFAYLKDLCIDGWGWRNIARRAFIYAKREEIKPSEAMAIYTGRLKMELAALKKQKFVPYFLMIRDLYQFAREAKIMVGPGRGSVGGSLVAYLLGITATDPIEHALIFERFISPFRIDMPDIDMDFEDRRRQEILEYIRNKYGTDKVCQIATIGKLSGKECIRSVSRVLEVPLNEVNQVTQSIIERSSGDERASQTIEDSFKDFEVCRQFNKKYPKVLHHAKKLEGMAKNLGIHAAGCVASPVPLTDLIPLEIRKHDGRDVVVSAFDMYGVAASGLVKLDVLGLRTLTVIKEALEAVEARHGRTIDMESADDVDLNDPKVLQGFTDHNYGGVFQYDTPGADKVCQGVNFTSFEDVAAMTALNRPGTSRSGLATKYVERKKNPKLVKRIDFHPAVSKITADTLGIIVYQEHVLRIFTDIAGFAPGTADSLRKTIAKKIGDETLGREREAFVEGALKHTPGMTEAVANKIMDAITFFGCLWAHTEVLTERGRQPICGLVPGDWIASIRDDGTAVRNRVKTVTRSGTKEVFHVITNHTSVHASAGHHWMVRGEDGSHKFKKTSELLIGDLIGYATNLKDIADEKPKLQDDDEELFGVGVRPEGVGEGLVFGPLPACVSVETDGSRQPGVKRAQQARRAGEGLEGRAKQGDVPRDCGASPRNERRGESGLGGRAHPLVPGGSRCPAGGEQGVPALRSAAAPGASGAEYADASRSSQGQEQEEQRSVQPGGDLPSVPLQGALGGKVSWSPVIGVNPAGHVSTYDLECEGEPANYVLANGLVCHNSYGFNKSHATAYGMIAYWCMWLKVYYPIEFYWALLKNEPDRIRVQQIAKDAKRHDIRLLPPHVNVSDTQFSIDSKAGAIRGSLVDIKGVGEGAATTIMEHRPYKDLADFADRIDRKKCNRGAVVALAKAGALDGIVPNVKWFLENAESFWPLMTAKKRNEEKVLAALDEARSTPDYNEEDKTLMASQVNPLAFGRHPIDAYGKFIEERVKVDIVDMSSETFFQDYDNKSCYIAGVMVEVKYNQIGDFHTGTLPSEEERKRQFWGARYANVNIEDKGGKQNRCKFDHDIFDTFRPTIDKGIGTPVLVHATASNFTSTLRAQFAVDLAELRKKVRAGERLDIWERIVTGDHPARSYPWKDAKLAEERWSNSKFFKSKYGGAFTGVVTNTKLKYDKNGNLMAFFGVIGGDGRWIDVVCFASVWDSIEHIVKPGRFLKMEIERKPDRIRGWSNFFNGGRIKWLKRGSVDSATSAAAE